MKVPQNPKIKDLKDCEIIGKPTKRHPKEAWAKVTGKAEYGIDIRVDNLKYAAVLHPRVFGAKVKSFDANKALKRKGVLKVKEIPTGIAVIAQKWWIAREALSDINVQWEEGEFTKISSDDLHKEYETMMENKGAIARDEGDTKKAFKEAHKVLETQYNFPFLAHTPMEPLNLTVHHQKDRAILWSGSQMQTLSRGTCAKILGIHPENITYKTPYLGGGFGRRGGFNQDYVKEGTFVAKDEPYPVMTLWTREDDVKIGNYRPMFKDKMKVALDKDGDITAMEVKVVGQSILLNRKENFEKYQIEGLSDHPYLIGNNNIQVYTPTSPIPTTFFRSVGHTHTAPIIEGIIDQAAYEAKKDAITYRLEHLIDTRYVKLLKEVARLSNWENRKKEKNVGYGVAIVGSFGSICAQIAKVKVSNNDFKVEQVWCSVDCGFAFNPRNVENQMISGINFGIGVLKYGEITIKNGETEQNNFYDYQVSRLSDTPKIEVSIINSFDSIGGIGEPGVPPILAAVPNAIFDAIGKRYTQFPIKIG